MNQEKLNLNTSQEIKFCPHCGASLANSKRSFFSRHKKLIITLIFIFIFFVIIISLISSTAGYIIEGEKAKVISGEGEDKIALINIDGLIQENDVTGFGPVEGTSARRIKKTLNEIADDQTVKGMLLRINSPGGSAVAAEEIYQNLLDFKKKKKIKIVVYATDVAASGGYYVAMAADHIIANPSSITGSIGVIAYNINLEELAKKYGVKSIVYKSGQYKDMLNPLRQSTKEEDQIMQSLINDSFENFVMAVTSGRKLDKARVKKLADGRVYSAKQAKQLHLIDNLGNLEDAIAASKKLAGLKEASVVEYGQPRGFLDAFLGSIRKTNPLSSYTEQYLKLYLKPGLLYLHIP